MGAGGNFQAVEMCAAPYMQGGSSAPRKSGKSASGPSSPAVALWGDQTKSRFCATFPDVARCRHGQNCSFAHSRLEIRAPLLTPEEEAREPNAMTHEFFTEKFKTLWCPVGGQHDWQLCMYAHTYQDVRRPPSIGYGHQLCPYWNKKDTNLAYSQRCPLGPRCPYSHGAKEQLYHPRYFRTLACRDLMRKQCPRRFLCAFHHKRSECRTTTQDDVDYSVPLKKEQLPKDWVAYFLAPPRFQDTEGESRADPQPFAPAMIQSAAAGTPGALYWDPTTAAARTPPSTDPGEDSPRTLATAGESAEVDDSATASSSPAEQGIAMHPMMARMMKGRSKENATVELETLMQDAAQVEWLGSPTDVACMWDQANNAQSWGVPQPCYVPCIGMPCAFQPFGLEHMLHPQACWGGAQAGPFDGESQRPGPGYKGKAHRKGARGKAHGN